MERFKAKMGKKHKVNAGLQKPANPPSRASRKAKLFGKKEWQSAQ